MRSFRADTAHLGERVRQIESVILNKPRQPNAKPKLPEYLDEDVA